MADESFIISVSGLNTSLKATFFPPLELNPKKSWAIGFCSLHTWNSIPNIYKNNTIHFINAKKEKKSITLPEGTYKLDDLSEQLENLCFKEGIIFKLFGNENTLKCTVRSDNYNIDYAEKNSIGYLLGFEPTLYEKGKNQILSNLSAILHQTRFIIIRKFTYCTSFFLKCQLHIK